MMKPYEIQVEKDKLRDSIVMKYLKAGGRIYPDDYIVFGLNNKGEMVSYLRKLYKMNIIRYSIDDNFVKYCELKK